MFPGQGSQSLGMGQAWAAVSPAARRAFEEADEALGMALTELIQEGPEEDLQLTENTQPALLATSVATLRALADLGMEPVAVAGHSLGEYSALVAAGSLGFADALRVVRERGRRMQEAVPVGEGAMAAILGLDAATVSEVVADLPGDGVCAVANFNAPEQIVIAGHARAVDRAVESLTRKGARRALRLPVSAPFHSPLMAPARAGLAPTLRATSFADPAVPVVVNVDGVAVQAGAEAREALERQVDGPVRWVESVRVLVEDLGAEALVEVGPGKVLCGLARRITPGLRTVSTDTPERRADLEALLQGKS